MKDKYSIAIFATKLLILFAVVLQFVPNYLEKEKFIYETNLRVLADKIEGLEKINIALENKRR